VKRFNVEGIIILATTDSQLGKVSHEKPFTKTRSQLNNNVQFSPQLHEAILPAQTYCAHNLTASSGQSEFVIFLSVSLGGNFIMTP
jgi:hypothetical protein